MIPWARLSVRPANLHVEVAVSPQATALTSVVEVAGPLSHRLPPTLVGTVRTSIPASAINVLQQMWAFDPQEGEVPEFLNMQTAGTQSRTLEEDPERLRSTPERTVRNHLEHFLLAETPSEPARRWADDPERQMSVLCSALSAYWRSAQPVLYPGVERRLRREAERLRMLVERTSPSLALNEFHPTIRQVDDELHYQCGLTPSGVPIEQIGLAPMAASSRTTYSNLSSRNPTVGLSYIAAASGPLGLGAGRQATGEDSLDRLIGATRAQLLRELSWLPATTTDLAKPCGSHRRRCPTTSRFSPRPRSWRQTESAPRFSPT